MATTLQETNLIQGLGKNLAATVAAALLSFGSLSGVAVASEFDVINSSTPSFNYLIDDAGVLNKTTKKSVNDRLYKLEVSLQPKARSIASPCLFTLHQA